MANIRSKIENALLDRKGAKRRREAERKRRQKLREQKGLKRGLLFRFARVLLMVTGAALLIFPAVVIAHPISYIPLMTTVLLVGSSWAYLQVLRRSLRVSVAWGQSGSSCERGESSQLRLQLANSSRLPFPRIELMFYVTDLFGEYDETQKLSCALGSRETTELGFGVTFAHLGTYRAGVSEVVIHDLVGLFSVRLKETAERAVTVRPRRVDLGESGDLFATPDEARSSLRPVPADDMDYASVRDYHFGDPLKTVHWKLSARRPGGGLYTRVFEAHVNPSLCIVLDSYAPAFDAEELMCLFDGMVEIAAALSAQARRAGIDAEVRYSARDGSRAHCHITGRADADALVENLRRITPVEDQHVANVAAAEEMFRHAGGPHGFSNIVMVTSRIDSRLIQAACEVGAQRRAITFYAAVPRSLEGKERERHIAPLHALEPSAVPYYLVESNERFTEVVCK